LGILANAVKHPVVARRTAIACPGSKGLPRAYSIAAFFSTVHDFPTFDRASNRSTRRVRRCLDMRHYRSRASACASAVVPALGDMQPILRFAFPSFHASGTLPQSVNRHLKKPPQLIPLSRAQRFRFGSQRVDRTSSLRTARRRASQIAECSGEGLRAPSSMDRGFSGEIRKEWMTDSSP
jgi:hypothetical protein